MKYKEFEGYKVVTRRDVKIGERGCFEQCACEAQRDDFNDLIQRRQVKGIKGAKTALRVRLIRKIPLKKSCARKNNVIPENDTPVTFK